MKVVEPGVGALPEDGASRLGNAEALRWPRLMRSGFSFGCDGGAVGSTIVVYAKGGVGWRRPGVGSLVGVQLGTYCWWGARAAF